MIGDGSELLLLIPSLAGVVGSCVLPILGAVPDGAIVLFSGMGPDAQNQLNIGVGCLAGSTIMLLTVPWALCVFGGAVDVDQTGLARYKGQPKLTNSGLTNRGVEVSRIVEDTAKVVFVTSLSYFIIQGPAILLSESSHDSAAIAKGESKWALLGLVVTLVFFFGYLLQQKRLADSETDEPKLLKIDQARIEALRSGDANLIGVMAEVLATHRVTSLSAGYQSVAGAAGGERAGTGIAESAMKQLAAVSRPFFDKYDVDRSGTINQLELALLFRDMGQRLNPAELSEQFESWDKDSNGELDFDEFVAGAARYVLRKAGEPMDVVVADGGDGGARGKATGRGGEGGGEDEVAVEEEDDEAEEVPEDLAHLAPEEQQRRILHRSLWMMGVGTLVVLVFSDAMVEVLGSLGKRTGIPSFCKPARIVPLMLARPARACPLIRSHARFVLFFSRPARRRRRRRVLRSRAVGFKPARGARE